jgi:hypothetical protein
VSFPRGKLEKARNGVTRIERKKEARRAYIARRRSLYVSLSTGDSLGMVSRIHEKKNLGKKVELLS